MDYQLMLTKNGIILPATKWEKKVVLYIEMSFR